MFKKSYVLLLLVLFCLLQASCSTSNSPLTNSGNNNNLPSETLNVTTKPINVQPQQESPVPKNEITIIQKDSRGAVKESYFDITKESYIEAKANIKIMFPQIKNLKDTNKQKVINSLIRDEVMQLLKQYKNGEVELSSLDIDYSFKLNSEKIISIQYTGISSFKKAAHPYSLHFVTNINVNKGTVIKLFDIINVNEKFMELFQTGTFKSVSLIYQEGYFEKYTTTELLETFKSANFYLTDGALGISLGVPYAMGDHAEFEINYKDIKSSMKTDDEIWNGISDSVSSGTDDSKAPLIYKNKKLGFQITFPQTWVGKYITEETDTGTIVFYQPKSKNLEKAKLFQISTWGSEKEWNEWWNNGGKDQPVPFRKLAIVNGNVLVKEGPTEAIYQGDNGAKEDSQEYDKMMLDVRNILSTFKELK